MESAQLSKDFMFALKSLATSLQKGNIFVKKIEV